MASESIFRAYDVRGIYGEDITEELAQKIGRALVSLVNGEGKTMLVGRNVRLNSKSLSDALIEGMLSAGFNVEDIGTVTTPFFCFASVRYGKNGELWLRLLTILPNG